MWCASTSKTGSVGGSIPSLALGGGVDVLPEVRPRWTADFAVDVHVWRHIALRADAGVVGLGAGVHGIRGGLGVVWRRPRPAPPPEPLVRNDRVWLPFPVCRWRDPDEAADYVARLGQETLARQAGGDWDAADGPPPQPVGGVVVAGLPGDEVRDASGQTLVRSEADGAMVVPHEVLAQERLSLVGGGRTVTLRAPSRPGYATWIRADAPPPERRVLFGAGSAVVSDAERAALAAWAEQTGGWSWRVAGSFSPEGSEATNLALAERRAEAVAEALVAAGVPEARVTRDAPRLPEADLPPEAQRYVVLTPVRPGDAEQASSSTPTDDGGTQ